MAETVLFLQHGDYREAFRRFAEGGEETYLDQLKSVRFVEALSERLQVVVAAVADEAYDEVLLPALRAIGVPRDRFHKDSTGDELFSAVSPSRVIPRSAHLGLLRASNRARVPCFPLLADIFQPVIGPRVATRRGLGAWVRLRRLQFLLECENVVGVGNHGLNASQTLKDTLSVPTTRITPWEWTPLQADPEPRTLGDGALRVFFAGAISEEKGAGDLVRASLELNAAFGGRLEIVLAGDGPALLALQNYVKHCGLECSVRFLGQTPRAQVISLMKTSDIVVVPSRHSYPEGMPNVIFEALAARTPIVLSDHPSFVGRLAEREDAVFFRAADARGLADAIQCLVSDHQLYSRLSGNSARALERLYVGTSWYRLVELFLADPVNKSNWVEQHSLAALAIHSPEEKKNDGAKANAISL